MGALPEKEALFEEQKRSGPKECVLSSIQKRTVAIDQRGRGAR